MGKMENIPIKEVEEFFKQELTCCTKKGDCYFNDYRDEMIKKFYFFAWENGYLKEEPSA